MLRFSNPTSSSALFSSVHSRFRLWRDKKAHQAFAAEQHRKVVEELSKQALELCLARHAAQKKTS
jgi:hypothetical protein